MKSWIIAALLTLATLEVGMAVLSKLEIIKCPEPVYSNRNTGRFWANISQEFGVWHQPYSSYTHKKSCFNVTYVANSYGARDVEREYFSDQERVVVLGDSFVEGYGVDSGDRITNLLEKDTGIPHLNFGTSGGFGTTAEMLLYQTLASRFSHNSVMIGMLPNNDFLDDDIGFGKQAYAKQYKPYLDGEYPNYRLVYYRPILPDPHDAKISPIKLRLREFSYAYNAVEYLTDLYAQINRIKSLSSSGHIIYSGYYDYTTDQFQKLRFAIESILATTMVDGVNVYLFSIPVHGDFFRYKENKLQTPPLSQELEALSKDLGFQYVDLLPLMYSENDDWKKYYLSCDGHWNAYGNRYAKELLMKAFSLYSVK